MASFKKVWLIGYVGRVVQLLGRKAPSAHAQDAQEQLPKPGELDKMFQETLATFDPRAREAFMAEFMSSDESNVRDGTGCA